MAASGALAPSVPASGPRSSRQRGREDHEGARERRQGNRRFGGGREETTPAGCRFLGEYAGVCRAERRLRLGLTLRLVELVNVHLVRERRVRVAEKPGDV